MARVLLINMPFSSLRWPALGISLLQAALKREGIDCETAYLNFDLAEMIGRETYDWINDSLGFVLGGERLFAKTLFGSRLTRDDDYHREVLRATDPGFPDEDREAFENVGKQLGAFLNGCFVRIDWPRYAAVGFTTTFQQTLASLALAARIKERYPAITICLGGANCEGVMGQTILERFPQIDLVFSGEADITFPPCMKEMLAGRPIPRCSGILKRAAMSADEPVAEALCGPVRDLDALPYPDFGAYFQRLARSPLREEIDPLLLFETARGCWWGVKSHCTFCGLNGGTIAFRSKSPERAVEELRHLRQTYGVRKACATDNILDFRSFRTMLPLLAQAGLDLELEYEVKTNLTRGQVDLLKAAGMVAVQLGIESLSTPILRLMRKGVSASQNLQTLKWTTAAGMDVKWNFLYGFPGEDPEAYANLPDLIANLTHLVPPRAEGRVRIDRFSPYFEVPEAFGLPRPRPAAAYHHVYPFDEEELASLAYYFTALDAQAQATAPGYVQPTLLALEAWREVAGTVTLRGHDRGDGVLVLLDTRPIARAFEYRLRGWSRDLYLRCDTARPLNQIIRHFRNAEVPVEEVEIKKKLQEWLEAGIMVCIDDAYLSLAII
ncbi:MAG: RiPP maturation radical SAM C-methyltransferase [Isosphaeraceae bacterium]